jgi:hypothetical protein
MGSLKGGAVAGMQTSEAAPLVKRGLVESVSGKGMGAGNTKLWRATAEGRKIADRVELDPASKGRTYRLGEAKPTPAETGGPAKVSLGSKEYDVVGETDTHWRVQNGRSVMQIAKSAAKVVGDKPAADIDSLFKGASQIVAPFPSAGRKKGESKLPPQEKIEEALRNPKLTPVDPKTVKTQQGFVTREGVAYYLTPKYRQTGETYADPADRGNRFPMIWKKPNGDMVLLSGNHRFTAALIEGRNQDAIIVE